jgi:hypothetical protein
MDNNSVKALQNYADNKVRVSGQEASQGFDNQFHPSYPYPLYPQPQYPAPCPGCGRCPYCGRGGYYIPFNQSYLVITCGIQNS